MERSNLNAAWQWCAAARAQPAAGRPLLTCTYGSLATDDIRLQARLVREALESEHGLPLAPVCSA
eukprot:6932052-Alexandrium_andersonii.AAC.1